jgi:hypothetical protein
MFFDICSISLYISGYNTLNIIPIFNGIFPVWPQWISVLTHVPYAPAKTEFRHVYQGLNWSIEQVCVSREKLHI